MLDLGFRRFRGRLNPAVTEVSINLGFRREGWFGQWFMVKIIMARNTYEVRKTGILFADRHCESKMKSVV
jgi:hypothetical protein